MPSSCHLGARDEIFVLSARLLVAWIDIDAVILERGAGAKPSMCCAHQKGMRRKRERCIYSHRSVGWGN